LKETEMKKKILKLTILIVLFVFYLILVLAYAGTPKMLIEETTWDFGNIPDNCVVSHEFWLKNVGTDTLKNINVRPG